jgi:carbamoyl-phosphate synthase small subunit
MAKALIALEDGTTFEGRAFAGRGEIFGELVFNTSMTGYQEILSDPSYHGQIVTLTYPLIGNYGINEEDVESWRPHAAALVVGECSRIPSNWRSSKTLGDYLAENGLIGVDDIDTRAITLHIRSKGAMKCVVSTEDLDPKSLVEKAKASPGLVGRDIASEVACPEPYVWPGPYAARTAFAEIRKDTLRAFNDSPHEEDASDEGQRFKVAVLDCGTKFNMLRLLAQRNCDLHVFPMGTPSEKVLAIKPDGLFITNGPGDPAGVMAAVEQLKGIIETGLPTFGICFGHQLLGLALGGKTYKLKFGHRGANQPVMDLQTGKVDITSQNHGFCVDKDSLDPEQVETTHINLNDQTSEGLRHKQLPIFSVQYHPEACPGPHDAVYLFDRFKNLMTNHKR